MLINFDKKDKAIMAKFQDPADYYFKILLLGQTGAGKSSLLNRYARQSYIENHSQGGKTVHGNRIIWMNNKNINVDVFAVDKNTNSQFTSGANAVFILCDVTDAKSLQTIPNHLRRIATFTNERHIKLKVLVGTKIDEESMRVIDNYQLNQTAIEYGFNCVAAISAKKNYYVDELFSHVVSDIGEKLKLSGLSNRVALVE